MRGQFSPLPAPLPRFAPVLRGSSWLRLCSPGPRRPPITFPRRAGPGPGCSPPPRLPPPHQGVSMPHRASRSSRRYPILNCGRLPAGSAGGCGQGGRGARHPPEVTVPATPIPRSLRRTEPAPSPLCPGKVGGRAGAAGGQRPGCATPAPAKGKGHFGAGASCGRCAGLGAKHGGHAHLFCPQPSD